MRLIGCVMMRCTLACDMATGGGGVNGTGGRAGAVLVAPPWRGAAARVEWRRPPARVSPRARGSQKKNSKKRHTKKGSNLHAK